MIDVRRSAGSGLGDGLKTARLIPGPQREVFQAWIDPQEFKQWWGPEECGCPAATIDARVGGRYRVETSTPDGRVVAVGGEYLEIKPPELLKFTWKWEHEPADNTATIVTISFRTVPGGTEVNLTHEAFLDAEVQDRHARGWTGTLNSLAAYFARADRKAEASLEAAPAGRSDISPP